MSNSVKPRILIVDDNESIHADYRKVLTSGAGSDSLKDLEASLFGGTAAVASKVEFEVDSAMQGEAGLEAVRKSLREDRPYAVAFIDMRMPPGWDGIETTRRIWAEYPDLEVVICTAYSDYSWDQIVGQLGQDDRLLILKKPFDNIEVRQMAGALSEKWAMRRKLSKRMTNLQGLVEERTRDLQKTMDELRVARDEALAAARAKSDFLANMSHEIRTPLTAIQGFTELLQQGCLEPDEARRSLGIVRENCTHLARVVNDILDLSKLGAGMLSVEALPCDPVHLAHEAVASLHLRAKEKGLTLKLETTGLLPDRIHTDPVRFRQILNNLVNNAVKFTERGEVVVALSRETRGLCVEVRDSGMGMDEQTVARLFQPFFQADATVTRRFGGTGLGLSICRQLAHCLGGDIEVRSRPGEGSTFRFVLPLNPPQGESKTPSARPKTEHVPLPSHEPQLKGCRVLLAEDNQVNNYLICTILRKAGAEVNSVADGKKAVETVVAEGPFDVVLLDLQMPVLDGSSAVKRLRAEGYSQPILALTAHSLEEARRACMDAGFDDFLTKPINLQRLVEAVHGWSQRCSASAK